MKYVKFCNKITAATTTKFYAQYDAMMTQNTNE